MVLDMIVVLFCLQHTILGKMAYAPTVGRLGCGEFPSNPRGFWQDDGYGILSVFKKDWDRFGGVYCYIVDPRPLILISDLKPLIIPSLKIGH